MSKSLRSGSLEDRARKIVAGLGGKWLRAGGMCCCPAHADRTPSLSVTIGRRAVLLHCFAGCTNEEVLRGIAAAGLKAADLFAGLSEPFVAAPRQEGPSRNAQRLWRDAEMLTASPAAQYLAQRSIEIASVELRYHPKIPLGPKEIVRFLPALIAAVRNDEAILAVHRTFLDLRTAKLAGFDRPKRALGSLGTGAVRLAMPRGGRLGLAEGIESALSAQQLFGVPCWATLGNERFGLVTIPESVRELHLFVDADAGGVLAEARARESYASEGRRIVTRRPLIDGQDWNDVLVARRTVVA